MLEHRDDERRRYVVGAVSQGRFFTVEFVVPVGASDGVEMIEQMLATVDVKAS